MQLKNKKLSFFVAFMMTCIIVLTSVVQAEPMEGWKGYGLFRISNSKFDMIGENVKIELQSNALQYNGEFILKNNSNTVVKSVLGMPANGIEKIAIVDKSSYLKWKKRSLVSLKSEHNIDGLLPEEESWYVFNVTLNPWETKIINIQFDAVAQTETGESYMFSYFHDRKLGFSNQTEKAEVYIRYHDFNPYQLMGVSGFSAGEFGPIGDLYLKRLGEDIDTIGFEYKDATGLALAKLQNSPMRRPKDIAKEFLNRNYDKASALCDEYINNPIDSNVTKEQVMFFKAESLRRLQNYSGYLNLVETLDTSKLQPADLKNKIIYDSMMIYVEQGSKEKLSDMYLKLEQDSSKSAQIMLDWMQSSNLFAATEFKTQSVFQQLTSESDETVQSDSKLKQWYKAAMSYKHTPWIIFALGILIGLFLKKIRFNRRKKRSMYLYRM